MRYLVDNDDKPLELDDAVEAVIEAIDQDAFDQYINEVEPEVVLWGNSYAPSEVFKEVDPTGYDTAFSDFCDGQHDYVRGELQALGHMESITPCGVEVESYDEDEDEDEEEDYES